MNKFDMLLKGKQAWESFCQNHPQFPAFLQDVKAKGIVEGTDVTIAVTYPDGQTKKAVGYIASLLLLSAALNKLPLGTAYAVWTGIGIIGTTVLGVFLFREQITLLQGVFILRAAKSATLF